MIPFLVASLIFSKKEGSVGALPEPNVDKIMAVKTKMFPQFQNGLSAVKSGATFGINNCLVLVSNE